MKRKEKRDMRKKGIAILLAICMGLLAIPAACWECCSTGGKRRRPGNSPSA